MTNETISGKKYQIKNAAGTENRFPYTVMEAVIGLNSYLQDQFSALADIYMPIEGITESKTGQEFVYRKSPTTIKAKSLTLDRIYGKTLAWNQLAKNGDFSAGTDYWITLQSSTFSVSDKVATLTWTSSYSNNGVRQDIKIFASGHKFYVAATIKNLKDSDRYYFVGQTYGVRLSATFAANEKKRVSGIINVTTDHGQGYDFLSIGGNPNIENSIEFANVICSDLTRLYGSEIDGMIDEQILAKFESEFPGYHDFGNKLISNDASAIETVGFNKWDEEWEVGTWDANGQKVTNAHAIRSKNYIPVLPNKAYYLSDNAAIYTRGLVIRNFDAEKGYISSSVVQNTGFTTPANVAYIVICTFVDDDVTTYQNNICINLSDPAKNGTYEPYRKTTLQLGLNNFKVKSHNIWDEEWTTGNGTNGDIDYSAHYHLVSKNFIPVIPGRTYYFKSATSNLGLYGYDANKEKISTSSLAAPQNTTFTIPDNVYFIKFQRGGSDLTYNHDICINLSSSFNGQYEPHGDITVTGGLKGDGTWADILYSNNHLTNKAKRVNLGDLTWSYSSSAGCFYANVSGIKYATSGSANIICDKYLTDANARSTLGNITDGTIRKVGDNIGIKDTSAGTTNPNTFKAAMDGVMLDYELATPIEYELVEPLVYSMAAGTTEERISPNSDGLSAPFCCDMTYDANANNDSANAQYAAMAGRLYNTHKLWGQDFDGSADVSGAMTGVDSINGLVTFGSNRMVEIGSQNSGGTARVYGLLSANSFSSAGNVNVGGNITTSGSNAQHSFDGTTTIKDLSVTSAAYFGKSNSPVDVYVIGQFTVGSASVNKPTNLYGTLNATGNTTIGGTFTVGTSSVNKATTLYGALTASGAVSFSDTLTIEGLTTFNGNAILPANKTFTIGPSSGTHATLEWDATNGCVKITGNLRVTGWIEQQGTQSNS